ncbi:Cu(I)-responsive transcriptional regulator [Pseudoprimorskyibacter insulae]|uniref:HTH-type transcriptional regulator HmrR n=1 Tax=Pseudoprimorskyibacter insulae TaxID=1695997 RepID=A0A2R8AYZ5_9RHOB|nr:Cu(I)-responsive transcriptional regulator [Pseudoprimorskyibacter insulae]SPF81230.1 HTH-type transcriptional regulator HmrR [Pseudoprimorskyibacter insulae]
MNIKEVADQAGLPAKTIRYYEDIGLVRARRGANGYRQFDATDLHKLAFLARARALGFSIEDCRALLALYEDKGRASADVKQIAEQHITQIEEKLAQLQSMHDTLTELARACPGNNRPDCPILSDLSHLGMDEKKGSTKDPI